MSSTTLMPAQLSLKSQLVCLLFLYFLILVILYYLIEDSISGNRSGRGKTTAENSSLDKPILKYSEFY